MLSAPVRDDGKPMGVDEVIHFLPNGARRILREISQGNMAADETPTGIMDYLLKHRLAAPYKGRHKGKNYVLTDTGKKAGNRLVKQLRGVN